MWLHTPESGKSIERIVKTLSANGIERVFLRTTDFYGNVTYKSRLRPRMYKNEDIFGLLCTRLKKEGIDVHAWIGVNLAGKKLLESKKIRIAVNRLGRTFVDTRDMKQNIPDWKPRYWACPSSADYRKDICGVVKELIEGYDIDGIHLDYIRYPNRFLMPYMTKQCTKERLVQLREEADFCYCDDCKEGFYKKFGKMPENEMHNSPLWDEWRKKNVVKTVREIRKTLSKSTLSASVFATPEIAGAHVFQDVGGFSRYLDFLVPMIYNEYYNRKIDWVGTAVKENRTAFKKRLLAGIGPMNLLTSGELRRGISAAETAGADGYSIFCYDQMDATMWKQVMKTKV